MSHLLLREKLNYLDERTFIIVNGFMREIINDIPSDIIYITLSYVDDHFMLYRGSYQWNITDPKLVENILNAQRGEAFTSEIFEIGKLKWMLRCLPNGDVNVNDSIDCFVLFMEILSMPKSWDHIIIRQTLQCIETNTKWINAPKYESSDSRWGWPLNTLLLSNLQNLNINKLTIIASIKILRIQAIDLMISDEPFVKYQSDIIEYQKQYNMEWIIHHNTINSIYFSDIIDEMFAVCYDSNDCTVSLKLCGLPSKRQTNGYIIDAIQVKWTIKIPVVDIQCSSVTKLGFSSDLLCHDSSILLPSFSTNDFNEIKEVLFIIHIEILNEYDLEDNVIGGNIENEWNQFIEQENNKQIDNDYDMNMNINNKSISDGLNVINCEILSRFQFLEQQIIGLQQKQNDKKRNDNKTDEFRLWLINDVGLEQYFDILVQNGFDNMNAIKTIKIEQLMDIGILKIGHRQQLMKCVQNLRNDDSIIIKKNDLLYLVMILFITWYFGVYCGRWTTN